MRIALFQPDIAANAGTIIRLGACMSVAIDIIEPCGFPFGDAALKRAGLDYIPKAMLTRHGSWPDFLASTSNRLVLATTKAVTDYCAIAYAPDDILLLGRETAGVPTDVAQACAVKIRIPMATQMRSLNVAIAAGMILGEMLRQTNAFPAITPISRNTAP